MASQIMGECLVCGKETKNRCSSCAKSGIDLFFCSSDCQKIVWHVHRLFCGPGKANPWRWPYLWPEEVEAAIDSLDKVANPKTDSQTLADRLLVLFTTPRDNLPNLIQSFSQPTVLPGPYETGALRCMRVAKFEREGILDPSPAVEVMTSLSLSSFLYMYEENPPPWMAGYLHRLSIYVAFMLDPRDIGPQGLTGPINRVFRYLDHLAQTDPDKARTVEGGFRRFLDKTRLQFAPGGVMWQFMQSH